MHEAAEIRLLGELEVRRSGRALPLPASKKTRALLGYLAVSGRAHGREQLCELLWQGPDDPRAALRWSLAKLRSVLGKDALVADRERVALAALTSDLGELRNALRGGVHTAKSDVLRSVAKLFRGELLEGLSLPDCYRYHEWCIAEREAVRAQRISVLAQLVERCATDPEAALGFARERVAVDPLSEPAHAAVIRLLAELGRKREALAQYETCARILSQETGAKPSPVLLEARMQIGHATAGQPSDPGASPPSLRETQASSPAPFVGRKCELDAIDRAFKNVAERASQPVLVVFGDPGIGKSRLLDEVGLRAREQGGIELRGRAFEAEMVRPYGPWIDALRAIPPERVPDGLRAELSALLPELGARKPASESAGDRASLFDSVVKLLAHLAEQGPVAVLLDDVQWFDETSAALLHYAARALDARRVLLAFAARPGELSDNPAALKLVRGLAREGRSEALELGALDDAATAALSQALAPGVDADRIVRESGGNPLLAAELARALLRGEDTVWDSIGGLIAERLARLDEAASELVAWAAALGKSFDLATLERVTAMAPLELLKRVGELERRGIVRASSDGAGYDFVHDLVRAGAYRSLSEPRRRVVHRAIAAALRTTGAGDTLDGEIAHHAALGGDAALAARSALSAARRCIRMFAFAEAMRLAEAGLTHVAALPAEERIRIKLGLWQAHVYAGASGARVSRVQAELGRAVLEAQDAGLHSEAAEGLHVLSVLQFDYGDLGAAHESTLRAVGAVKNADPLVRAQRLGDTARCLLQLERDMEQAHAMYLEARLHAERAGRRVLSVEWAGGILCAFTGRPDEAVPTFERALELSRAEGDRWSEFESLRHIVQIELEQKRPERALERSSELLEVAEKMGEGSELPAARALTTLCRMARGDEVAPEVEAAIAMLRDVDAKGMLAYVLNVAAEYDVLAGRLDAAAARACEALRAAELVSRKSQMALSHTLLARAALGRGDADGCRRELELARVDIERPFGLSARARSAIESVAAEAERTIKT